MSQPKGSYCILSLDGGGVRGVIETVLLTRIIMVYPNFLDQVDLITGASAGGILALVLAAGKSNNEAAAFFKKIAPQIFHRSWMHEIASLDSCIAPTYTNAKLKEVLYEEFGDIRLKDLPKKVLIPSFQLDNHSTAHVPEEDRVARPNGSDSCEDDDYDFEIVSPHHAPSVVPKKQQHRRWAPRFFHNLHHSKTQNHKALDVALRTSAAPTYFPIYQGFVDGGVYANNPSLCAVTSAISSGIPLDQIVVLSLSTGRDGKFVSPEQYGQGDWGLAQWAPTLIDMLLDSNVEISDFQCAQLLGGHYHRVDPLLPRVIDLDQPNYIPLLEEIANSVDITTTLDWIKQFWFNPKTPTNFTQTPTTSPTFYANNRHHQQPSSIEQQESNDDDLVDANGISSSMSQSSCENGSADQSIPNTPSSISSIQSFTKEGDKMIISDYSTNTDDDITSTTTTTTTTITSSTYARGYCTIQ